MGCLESTAMPVCRRLPQLGATKAPPEGCHKQAQAGLEHARSPASQAAAVPGTGSGVEVPVGEEEGRHQGPAVEAHGDPLTRYLDPHTGPSNVDEVLPGRRRGRGGGAGIRESTAGLAGNTTAAALPVQWAPHRWQTGAAHSKPSAQAAGDGRTGGRAGWHGSPWPLPPAIPSRSSAWRCTWKPGQTRGRTAGRQRPQKCAGRGVRHALRQLRGDTSGRPEIQAEMQRGGEGPLVRALRAQARRPPLFLHVPTCV